jgi:WD40 repeat protein
LFAATFIVSRELINVAANRETIACMSGSVVMIAFIPRLALGLTLWMLAGPVKADNPLPAGAVARLSTGGRITAAALSGDGGDAFTAAQEGTIQRWDALTGRQRGRYLGHKAEVVGLLLSPDGRTLFSQSKDNSLRAWDVDSGAQRWRRDGVDGFWCRPALSPDGKTLAAAGSPNVLKLFEAATGKSLHDLPAKSGGVFVPLPSRRTPQRCSL